MPIKNGELEIIKIVGTQLEIDEEGRVWRIAVKTGCRWTGGTRVGKCKRRRAESDPGRYLQVRAMVNGHRFHAYAHRLVWLYFNGPIPDGKFLNHKNGITTDNRLSNLEIVTAKENTQHSIQVLKNHSSVTSDINGESNPMNKISRAQAVEIKRRRASGEKLKSIAHDYGVSIATVSDIYLGRRWAILD